ncbi:MAG TPA: ABC transporter permease [Candidatus Hydrogenedentes bacterium]|nr:ABC transporter permease [Candidatus Hydrogenedentota bacterium]HQH52024.1 ABC transporter permease [Candidatus Hydrogenedentota bacterium]
MIGYIIRRVLLMIPTLFVISVITFIIIQLPPGDYLTTYIANLQETGEEADEALVESLRVRYGLDKPFYEQYFIWMRGMLLRGDLGQSFSMNNKPVTELIGERVALTVVVTFFAIVFTWIVAIPIGIYSATHQYKVSDYFISVLGFIGMATPEFSLALLVMYFSSEMFGVSVGGLFSDAYIDAPWSWARVGDLLVHIWVPVVILGVAGTAGMIRTMRANLLDQLEMPYVVTARAKGVSETRLLVKYPVRVAINPMISTIGWMLPALFSGSAIVAMVLGLPMIGPLLLRALMEQDMYLAGSLVMIMSVLTVIGTLISDILLAWVDPRIRLERQRS